MKKAALRFILLPFLLVFGAGWANAIPITITGQGAADGNWDVMALLCDRTVTECQTQLMAQVWYQDSALAKVFAETVGTSLGFLNLAPQGDYTPYFNYAVTPTALGWAYSTTYSPGNVTDFSFGPNNQYWSVAERVEVPEPAILTLLGIGLVGIRFIRRSK
jgi:hypothetical protein